VTGLQGLVSCRITIRHGDKNEMKRQLGEGETWIIRWDWDETKDPHVNMSIRSKDAVKFAFKASLPLGDEEDFCKHNSLIDSNFARHTKQVYFDAVDEQTFVTRLTEDMPPPKPGPLQSHEKLRIKPVAMRLAQSWVTRYFTARRNLRKSM
jgi:hypothetical protein